VVFRGDVTSHVTNLSQIV